MIADLNPREFKRDVESIRLRHIADYKARADAWWRKNSADRQTKDFARRLAVADEYQRAVMLGQNLSPRGNPALTLEPQWWTWKGYG